MCRLTSKAFCKNIRDHSTVKLDELLTDSPLTVTLITPVVALDGTVATITVLLALVRVADVPLKVTLLFANVVPSKPVPVMVTVVPDDPLDGEKLVIVGMTVKLDVDDAA